MDIDDDRLAKSVKEEGKCLLGYNTNAGSSIHLRLRTDERTAFRPYNSLINTLLHELSHNVFGPHNGKRLKCRVNQVAHRSPKFISPFLAQFWALFAELKARYLVFHQRAAISRPSLQANADIATEEMEDIEGAVMQEVMVDRQAPMDAVEMQRLKMSIAVSKQRVRAGQEQQGQTLGGGSAGDGSSESFSVEERRLRVLEGGARRAEQQVGDVAGVGANAGAGASGAGTGDVGDDMDVEISAAEAAGVSDGAHPPSCACCSDSIFTAAIEPIEVIAVECAAGGTTGEGATGGATGGAATGEGATGGATGGATTGEGATGGATTGEATKEARSSGSSSSSSVVTKAGGSASTNTSTASSSITCTVSSSITSTASTASSSITSTVSSSITSTTTAALDSCYDDIPLYLQGVGFDTCSREYRIADAVMRTRKESGAAALTCFETLISVVSRILASPSEPKYRRIRLGNKLFRERVGRFAPALEFLRAAGFEELDDAGQKFLLLQERRMDPGLLWLAKGLLEQHLPAATQ
jgi:hypothetical protein